MAESRPLLRRVLSFREPLLLIPYLLGFLGAAASAFFGSYSSFLHSFARSLSPSAKCACAKCACAAAAACTAADDLPRDSNSNSNSNSAEAEEPEDVLSPAEVEAIMARIGVPAAGGRGEGLAAALGRDEVGRLFEAEEPSFAEVRRAFAVFDADRDGFIGAADLRGALARLGVREDDAACRDMIAAAGGGRDGRMSLFQFVTFLEAGLC